ncbi:hypothetical protein [Streptomyces sp. B6B3]
MTVEPAAVPAFAARFARFADARRLPEPLRVARALADFFTA